MPPAAPGGPPIRLVLLFGGQSAEHDISRVTARHVLDAVDPERYRVDPVGITRDGQWVRAEGATAALPGEGLPALGPAVDPLPVLARDADEQVVVFPLLHGPMGEDGTVQGLCELADVPYVGCGVLASAVAMDKLLAKQALAGVGLPQGRWLGLHADQLAAGDGLSLEQVLDQLGAPVFVKPANMGSSVGVSKAGDLASLEAAVELAATYDEWLVVEEMIDGREIECGVLGTTTEPRASLPGEIVAGAEFYDYDDKYHDGAAELHVPARLDERRTAEVQELACRAFTALRCDGMSRVDLFFEPEGRGLLINEVNTIPGFTPISMYPRMWEASGLSYPQLVDELVALALARHRRHRRRTDVAT